MMHAYSLHVVPENAGPVTTGGYVVAMLLTTVTHTFRNIGITRYGSPLSRGRQ
jgi:hypothetical protein